MKTILIALGVVFLCSAALCSPKAVAKSKAAVTIDADRVLRPLSNKLFGVNVTTHDRGRMLTPEFVGRVKELGFTSCRFPNGCEADRYNWKNPRPGEATVDEFLDFCEQIGAEAYYTINMQGGTDNLPLPIPGGATLDERIRCRHEAPNPCGDTNYHFGTLAEALELVQKHTVERALAGRKPILVYEMGNENWGQSRTDWPPDVYARTIEVYARAMREVLAEAKWEHPELAKLELYIVAVGYPVMGNNMKLVDTPDRKINLKWTRLLNKLREERVIDAVQEHFYPYGSANGGTLAWAVHNLHNIIVARKGKPNSRLGGYRDPELAYNMPMEHTEWNVKCWGGQWKTYTGASGTERSGVPETLGFEKGPEGWTIEGLQCAPSALARKGEKALSVKGPGTLSLEFPLPQEAKILAVSLWVRTAEPEAVTIRLEQVNDGEHKGATLGEYTLKLKDMWGRVGVGARPFADTEQVRFSVNVTGDAEALLDEAVINYSTDERGQLAMSSSTFEQELFCVDALREMALGGCPRAHLHHLSGDYPCGAMSAKGEIKDLGKAFQFFAGAYGDQIVSADCECSNFGYYSSANSIATDFNALAPDRDDIPELGILASRKGRNLYLLLINRTSDRDIEARIKLSSNPAEPRAALRTLTGQDIDVAGATLTESQVDVSREFTHTIPPYTAQILTIKL